MEPLPTANTEITQFFRQWLETFAGYVREVDYASARPLFHPDVLAFGTYNDVISGIDQWVATQWDNVWPKTTDFRFVLEQTSVLASPKSLEATDASGRRSAAAYQSASCSCSSEWSLSIRPLWEKSIRAGTCFSSMCASRTA